MSTILEDGTVAPGVVHIDAPVLPTALTWGIILAVVSFLMTLVTYNMGMMDIDPETGAPPSTILSSVISFAITLAITFFGLKAYRDNANAGQLSIGRGLLWSLMFGLVAGVVGAILTYVFFEFIATDFTENMLAVQRDALETQGLDDDSLEQSMSIMETTMSSPVLALMSLIGSVITAVITGLISSFIVKTR